MKNDSSKQITAEPEDERSIPMNPNHRSLFRNRISYTVALVTLAAGVGWGVNETLDAKSPRMKQVELKIDDRQLPSEQNGYSKVIQNVGPSVVQIDTTTKARPASDVSEFPGWNNPLFRQFFGNGGVPPRMETPRQRGLGSGVVVTSDGYILTNNHVVENADTVKVTFPDGRELEAKIVGKDPETDVAVLKVDASDLPFMTMADSDHLEVGDLVLAIGNPFGIGQTVTMGIVSATGRATLGLDYEDFIQTDAAINPGNSGGALIDTAGRLVGINTAILSRSGGNQGIGFAIPSNLARSVMSSLVENGHVTRGYLGVRIQDVDPSLAKAFKLDKEQGALIADVVPDSPAAKAGLHEGDVIVQFNHKPVQDSRHLKFAVAEIAPGKTVPVELIRNGDEKNIDVTVQELPGEKALASNNDQGSPEDKGSLKGVAVTDINPSSRTELELPKSVQGALIAQVEPDSAASEAGLRPGDVIQEINRQPVNNAEDALRLTQNSEQKSTLVRVWRQGGSRFIVVDEAPTS